MAITTLSTCAAYLILYLRRPVLNQLRNLPQKKVLAIFLAVDWIIATFAMLAIFRAIAEGPISLVSTISATRPAFVLLLAYILSRAAPKFLNWEPGRGMLIVRIIATVMIVTGIVIINIT